MEPGIPDMNSKATLLGMYNVDPSVTFWATPPTHGCLTGYVVHPAAFTFTSMLQLEDYGFCKKGEGGEYVSSGITRLADS